MKQWEYCVLNVYNPSLSEDLANLGLKGWELVCSYSQYGDRLIFKREKQDAGISKDNFAVHSLRSGDDKGSQPGPVETRTERVREAHRMLREERQTIPIHSPTFPRNIRAEFLSGAVA